MNEQLVIKMKNTPAFREGAAKAAQNILNPVQHPKAVNPYPKGSEEHIDWVSGFHAAACEM